MWYSNFFCIHSIYGSHLLHNVNSSWVPLIATFQRFKHFSSYFVSSSAHKIVHPSRAQDACDPLLPLHLPAPVPPPPVHQDREARKGQRSQSSKTQRRQVQIGL